MLSYYFYNITHYQSSTQCNNVPESNENNPPPRYQALAYDSIDKSTNDAVLNENECDATNDAKKCINKKLSYLLYKEEVLNCMDVALITSNMNQIKQLVTSQSIQTPICRLNLGLLAASVAIQLGVGYYLISQVMTEESESSQKSSQITNYPKLPGYGVYLIAAINIILIGFPSVL